MSDTTIPIMSSCEPIVSLLMAATVGPRASWVVNESDTGRGPGLPRPEDRLRSVGTGLRAGGPGLSNK